MSFEEIAKKLGVDFSKAKNGKVGKKSAARTEGLLNRRGYSPLGF
jgi:hypothetical protein